MVGIVIIAHSHSLATGVREMALQMCRERPVVIAAAGGLDDQTLGTSYDRIEKALNQAWSEDGVLILMDMGSAVMTTQMVLEALPPEKQLHIRLSRAPLVEGAVAAAAHAAAGQTLDEVQRAAEDALRTTPKIEDPAPSQGPDSAPWLDGGASTGSGVSLEVIVPNAAGLHARPAMQFVRAASRFQSRITLQNLTRQTRPVNAKMPMQVAFGAAARQGDRIRVQAIGADAEKALEVLGALVENGFGEPAASPPPRLRTSLMNAGPPLVGPPLKQLQGIAASEGIVIAPAHVHCTKPRPALPDSKQEPLSLENERERLRQALAKAATELTAIQDRVEIDLGRETGWIFEFQRMILEDGEFVQQLENVMQHGRRTAEAAVQTVFSALKAETDASDPALRTKAVDLEDMASRLKRLLSGDQVSIRSMDQPCIVVAASLTPSDVVHLDRSLVRGIATALGGATDHTAILARSWGIPAVTGLGESILTVADHTCLALNGNTGRMEIDPDEKTIRMYRKQAGSWIQFQTEVLTRACEPALTLDGESVPVWANVSRTGDVKKALQQGAEGIGLLRTEFLYLDRPTLPKEEEQFQVYRDILRQMGRKPVVMRTLDTGGDKPLAGLSVQTERNPFLGVRGIRLCLKRPDLFQPQLRAMLRAAAHGNVKILFPMITTLEEVHQAKAAIALASDSLAGEGVEHNPDVEIGIMIETPAAALKADTLARHVDFFSIGSNDLTQYTLACDRENRDVDALFDPWDPAVLLSISDVIRKAHASRIPVSLCGEFAAQEKAVPFLLGLGLDVFSVSPTRLPSVKQWIRQQRASACRDRVKKMYGLP